MIYTPSTEKDNVTMRKVSMTESIPIHSLESGSARR